jgi:hypothetical protein
MPFPFSSPAATIKAKVVVEETPGSSAAVDSTGFLHLVQEYGLFAIVVINLSFFAGKYLLLPLLKWLVWPYVSPLLTRMRDSFLAWWNKPKYVYTVLINPTNGEPWPVNPYGPRPAEGDERVLPEHRADVPDMSEPAFQQQQQLIPNDQLRQRR